MTMTEPEAQALEARLRRIWDWKDEVEWKRVGEGFSQVEVQLSPQVALLVSGDQSALWWQHPGRVWGKTVVLVYGVGETEIDQDPRRFFRDHPPHWQEFLTHWLPLFRRGLWLSGADIEATAHEKVEWIQGFTREELEAWNLKM